VKATAIFQHVGINKRLYYCVLDVHSLLLQTTVFYDRKVKNVEARVINSVMEMYIFCVM